MLTNVTARSRGITSKPSQIRRPSWSSPRPTPKRPRSLTRSAPSCARPASSGRRIASLPAWSRPTLSEAERGLATTYRPGDVIQFHQNAKGFKKGDRLIVTDPAAVPLAEAAKFQLYRSERIDLAEGDKIRFTATVKTLDGKHKLSNGSTKTVAGFTPAGDMRLDNGWVVSADAGHFRGGFVETSFGSQGRTVQRAILAMAEESLPATNQEQMYVECQPGQGADDALYRQQGGGAGGGAAELAEAGRVRPRGQASEGRQTQAVARRTATAAVADRARPGGLERPARPPPTNTERELSRGR